jgi:hypothetical protein
VLERFDILHSKRIEYPESEDIMSLGTCRHCGAGEIATEAAFCRHCQGWRPNPNWLDQLKLRFSRVIGLVLLLVTAAVAVGAYIQQTSGQLPPENANGVFIACGIFGLGMAMALFNTLMHPYGRPPGIANP